MSHNSSPNKKGVNNYTRKMRIKIHPSGGMVRQGGQIMIVNGRKSSQKIVKYKPVH